MPYAVALSSKNRPLPRRAPLPECNGLIERAPVPAPLRRNSCEFRGPTFRKSVYRYSPQKCGPPPSPLLFGFFFRGSVPAFEFLELAHYAPFNAAPLPVAPGTPDALKERTRIGGPTTDWRSRVFPGSHHSEHFLMGNGPPRRSGRGVRRQLPRRRQDRDRNARSKTRAAFLVDRGDGHVRRPQLARDAFGGLANRPLWRPHPYLLCVKSLRCGQREGGE